MENKLKRKEISILKNNKYLKHISKNSITYTDEFKELLIKECLENNKTPIEVFTECGIDIEIIGYERIENAYYRWLKLYKTKGNTTDNRKGHSGRPKKKKGEPKSPYVKKKKKDTNKKELKKKDTKEKTKKK